MVINDENDARIPADARLCLRMLEAQLRVVKEQILENARRVRASARESELGRRLMEIPGVGPLLASAFVATVADLREGDAGGVVDANMDELPTAAARARIAGALAGNAMTDALDRDKERRGHI